MGTAKNTLPSLEGHASTTLATFAEMLSSPLREMTVSRGISEAQLYEGPAEPAAQLLARGEHSAGTSLPFTLN